MGDYTKGTSDDAEVPEGQQKQEQGRRQDQQQQQQQQSDLPTPAVVSSGYTPQMWMDDMERLSRSDGAVCSSLATALLEPLRGAIAAAVSAVGVDLLGCMLRTGRAVNVPDDKGATYLTGAAGIGLMGMTRAFLAAGADVNLRCGRGMSALDWSSVGGHVETVTVLIEHGAEVNAADASGWTALHFGAAAGKAEVVRLLCSSGADVDKADGSGSTPLLEATRGGHAAAARALLGAGADGSLRSAQDGWSSLDWAAASTGHPGVLVELINQGVDVNAATDIGVTALHIGAVSDNAEAIDLLVGAGAALEAEDATGASPLCGAAAKSNLAAALALLRHGASVSKQNAVGETPLHLAAINAGKRGSAEVVDLLLRRGADEKAMSSNGQTAMDMIGAGEIEDEDVLAEEDVERVRLLLSHAPADRAWRRHGFLVMCRAYHPSGRVQLGQSAHREDPSTAAKKTCRLANPSRAEADWAGVASMLMGVGSDPISQMGDGADIIFVTIAGFL